ncbi:hypothetical protein ACOSP7_000662 [Xanthoceras sorbifolium]
MELFCQVIVDLLAILLISRILQISRIVLWRLYTVTKSFRKQGIIGPRYMLVSSSLKEMKKMKNDALKIVLDTHSNDITDRVVPYYNKWSSQYGETFMYWHGMEPKIYISDLELAKQILSNKFGFYPKPQLSSSVETLIGKGLVLLNGQDWARHKKIINYAFNVDKLEVIVSKMATLIISILEKWENHATTFEDQCTTMEMKGEFKRLTYDIIARAGFGISYIEGREIFKVAELEEFCASKADVFIPGSRYLPTPSNIRMWKLDRMMKNTIRNIIESRLKAEATGSPDGYGGDLLGVMCRSLTMVQSRSDPKLNMSELIEECKTFLFGGSTTAYLLTWAVFLLCIYPEWQSKLGEEVLKEFGEGIPNADMLAKLKLVNMVLLEALRLYGPSMEMQRKVSTDMKLGNITIPKDTCILIPTLIIHRNKTYWGEDADEFNPLRFANGISQAAKHPHALFVFGAGQRVCIGQTFAMVEAKMIIALMLQRFSLSLSYKYKHSPVYSAVLQPQFGLPKIFALVCTSSIAEISGLYIYIYMVGPLSLILLFVRLY